MSLHAPRVAPEKLTPHRPGDVQFSEDIKEVDMVDQYEFIIGDCGAARINGDGLIDLEFLPVDVSIDGKMLFEISDELKNADIVSVENISAEQAYLLGKALLMAAKLRGISE